MNVEADQIIDEISTIIEKDPVLVSFDIFPATRIETDESAVMYVDHNLALKSWSVKHLYSYVHLQLLRETAEKNNEPKLLTVALLLNPYVKTFWNRRRKLVLKGNLDPYSELRYAALILTYKPKVQDVFTYRKWLLQRIFEKRLKMENLLVDEMTVIENAAERFTNNHMAWDYARWLLNFVEQDDFPENILESFWIRNSSWISTHVTDFSAFSFRQKLIKMVIHFENKLSTTFKSDIARSCKKYSELDFSNDLESQFKFFLIVNEIESNENLICFYVNHESLWHYRRFLYYVFIKILPRKIAEKSLDSESTNLINYESYQTTLFAINRSFLTNTIVNNDERFIRSHEKWSKDFGIFINNNYTSQNLNSKK